MTIDKLRVSPEQHGLTIQHIERVLGAHTRANGDGGLADVRSQGKTVIIRVSDFPALETRGALSDLLNKVFPDIPFAKGIELTSFPTDNGYENRIALKPALENPAHILLLPDPNPMLFRLIRQPLVIIKGRNPDFKPEQEGEIDPEVVTNALQIVEWFRPRTQWGRKNVMVL